MLVRRKNVAELKQHAPFQNRGENNIVAECVQAQKKNVEKYARTEKNVAELKKTCAFSKRKSE